MFSRLFLAFGFRLVALLIGWIKCINITAHGLMVPMYKHGYVQAHGGQSIGRYVPSLFTPNARWFSLARSLAWFVSHVKTRAIIHQDQRTTTAV